MGRGKKIQYQHREPRVRHTRHPQAWALGGITLFTMSNNFSCFQVKYKLQVLVVTVFTWKNYLAASVFVLAACLQQEKLHWRGTPLAVVF